MAVGMEQAGGSRRRHGRETLRAPCWHIKHKPSSGGRHRPTLLCAPVRQQVALRLAGKVESSLWTDARALPEVRAWPAVQRDNAERLRQRAGQLKPGALLERAWVWAAAEAIVEAGAAAAPGIVVTAVRPTNLESAVNLRAARQEAGHHPAINGRAAALGVTILVIVTHSLSAVILPPPLGSSVRTAGKRRGGGQFEAGQPAGCARVQPACCRWVAGVAGRCRHWPDLINPLVIPRNR